MSVVEIDEKGRMTLPKEIGLRKSKVLIIPTGTFFIMLPLQDSAKIAEKWLVTEKERKELKQLAEKEAMADAVARAKRRKQLCKHSINPNPPRL